MGAEAKGGRPVVAVVAYERNGGSLHAAVSECSGFQELRTFDRVLIKPSVPWGSPLSWKAPPYGFATTPRVSEGATVRILRRRGAE